MKDKVFVIVTTLGLLLTVGVLATIYTEQVFAVLLPEINSGGLTGQDGHIGKELAGIFVPDNHRIDFVPHTHPPREP